MVFLFFAVKEGGRHGLLDQEEISEKIAMEKARFVHSLTDIQPFKVMYDLCEVMIRNSLANGKEDQTGYMRSKRKVPRFF
jgi:hypothetical protein